ncbi:MAG: sugar transferase [Anaerolineae bacterium]|nr:sugar transferase [Anaerolineae bacterium]MCI0609858.1 sugar transferase [Anaerolineae bacterium]
MSENIRTAPLRLRPSEHRTILFVGDLITAVASVFAALYTWRQYNLSVRLAELIAADTPPARIQPLLRQLNIEAPFWFYLLPIVWMLLLVELYEPHVAGSGRKTTRGIAIAAFIGLAAYSLVFTISQDPTNLPRIGVGAFLLFASVLTLAWRVLFIRIYKTTGQRRRILLIGAGKAGQTVAELYRAEGTRPFNIVGFIDDDMMKVGKTFNELPVLGTCKQLLNLIDMYRISDLVVAINGEIKGATFQSILDAQEKGVDVTRMPILYEEMTSRVPVHHLESDWIIRSFVDELRVSGFYDLFKRVVDILGGAAGLLIFAISFPFLGLAVAIDSGFPVLYSQPRLGRGGLKFTIYKFRTMHQGAEQDNGARTTAENDPRVTRVGGFLRKSRLDELPQFWNVLRGEMSLVGPRAEIPELVAEYQKQIPFYRARLLVKPGLTGWAQINYGYVASVTETAVKLEYDLYYIKHRTFTMDFQIILRTIGTVIRRTGR